MRKLLFTGVAVAMSFTAAYAHDAMSKAEIAKLPADQVQAIKTDCARKWSTDFEMRVYCENQQYEALQTLIAQEQPTVLAEQSAHK